MKDQSANLAHVLRSAYEESGSSNPIGTFTCPHCLEICSVEYATTDYEFPSGASRAGRSDGLDIGRCFGCDAVSYWRILDLVEGLDWCDLPRKLVFPSEQETSLKLASKRRRDALQKVPVVFTKPRAAFTRSAPMSEFAMDYEVPTSSPH